MTHLAAAFVILLTFVSGPKHTDHRVIQCRDRACVEDVLKHAPGSRHLRRLRVFKAEEFNGTTSPFHWTPFPPEIDLTFD